MQRPTTPSPPPASGAQDTNTPRSRRAHQDSLNTPDADPWASVKAAAAPKTNGTGTRKSNGIPEAATAYAIQSAGGTDGASDSGPVAGGGGWNAYNGSNTSGGFSEQPTLGGGFGDSGENQDAPSGGDTNRVSAASTAVHRQGTGETVIVTMLPEKEGMFLFQHRNYEVKLLRKASSVVRRYSDFVWLLDCLQKRYPFRRLPLLPPKRVSGKTIGLSSAPLLTHA